MNIVPIIHKIVEHEGIFYALNEQEETVFATEIQEVANMYYAIPDVLERQAAIIHELSEKLNAITDEYNSLILGMMQSGSNLLH